MRYIFILSVLLSVATNQLFGQEKKFEELNPDLIEWGEGSILLASGEELKGMVRFNDKIGIVSYESGSISHSYGPRSIAAFEFYDEKLQRQRVFYSLEFEDKKAGIKRPFFFEVLRDFKTFAVISKVDPVEISEKTTSPGTFMGNGVYFSTGVTNTTIKITQTETIYFLGEKGDIEPYLKLIRKVVDRSWYDREVTKSKMLDDDVLKKYFSEAEIQKMLDFSQKNKLQFEVKEDFVKILAGL
ncbi:MAG TPA: hypothetical protein VIM75_09450 [Ohtaekwangia sp.]|uniref:hypothetical protein n=1 Tax=Ohtaekwangia sp. TaxID=2066019 RepID=UPI002F949778